MALESGAVGKIIKHLNRMPRAKVWKNHGSAASEPGIPDIIGTSDGRFLGFEGKKRGEFPTFLQSKTLHALHSTGACVGIVRDVEDADLLLSGRASKCPDDRERCPLCQLPVNGRGRLCWAVQPEEDALPDPATVPVDLEASPDAYDTVLCVKCGHPRHNHPLRHPFVQPMSFAEEMGFEDVI